MESFLVPKGFDPATVPDASDDLNDPNQPTVCTPYPAAAVESDSVAKPSRQQPSSLRRTRKRLRVVRKILKKTVPEGRSQMLY